MTTMTIFRGEKKAWRMVATDDGAPLDLTNADIRVAIRADVPPSSVMDDTDADVYKMVGDGITITDGAAGEFEFELVKADTFDLAPRAYHIGIEAVQDGETDPIVLYDGMISILGDKVRST